MHFDGLELSGALEKFYFLSLHNFGSKCKHQLFEENKGFKCISFRIEVQVISNPSSRFKKKTPNPEVLLMNDFYDFFKNKLIFRILRYFRKSSTAHTKIIVCVLFHVNQGQYSLIS